VHSKIKNSNLVFRKLKISDYYQFQKLFLMCFSKKVSFDFYKWRYFSSGISCCYGVFKSSKLIANVGLVEIKLNNKKKEKIFSRHSSMVLEKYRGIGIFSDLLKKVKKKISTKVRLIAMWPNKKNFASFGISKKNIIKKKYYLYKNSTNLSQSKEIQNLNINKLIEFKKFIINTDNLFYKNFLYFKKRYLYYRKNDYFINQFEFKKFTSFFILKRNIDNNGKNFVILEHFGAKEIYLNHLSYLIKNQNKLVFLSKKRINKSNCKLVDSINFHIGIIKNLNLKNKNIVNTREIYLGDTDIFITS